MIERNLKSPNSSLLHKEGLSNTVVLILMTTLLQRGAQREVEIVDSSIVGEYLEYFGT